MTKTTKPACTVDTLTPSLVRSSSRIFFIILSATLLILIFPAVAACQSSSVTDHGAKGDGVTDDRGAIQRAIDSCPNGGTVNFPAGTYRLNSTVYLKSGITIKGAGAGQTVLLMPKQNSPTALLWGRTLTGTSISGIGFRGSGAFVGREYGLSITGAKNCSLNNLRFDDLAFGMKLGAGDMSSNWMVTNIVARNCRIAFFLASCTNSTFNGLDLHGEREAMDNNRDHTVYIEQEVNNCIFNDCTFSGGAGWALQFWADQGSPTHDIIFNNTVIDARNGNHPIVVGSGFSNISLNNTTIHTRSGDAAIWFYGGRDFVFDRFEAKGGAYLVLVDDNLPVSNIMFRNGTFDGRTLLAHGWGANDVTFQNVGAPGATSTTASAPPTTTTRAPMTTTTEALKATTTTTVPTTTTTRARATTTTSAPPTTTTRAPMTTTTEALKATTTTTVRTTTTTRARATTTTTVPATSASIDTNPTRTAGPSALTIISPEDGAAVRGQVEIRLAAPREVKVSKVHFFIDGRLISVDYKAPYGFTWNTAWMKPGSTHTIKGVAYDQRSREIGSTSVKVTVAGAIQSRSSHMYFSARSTAGYPDLTPNTPYYEAANNLIETGAISGFSDGHIGLDRPITRAQFAKIASVVLGVDCNEVTAASYTDLGAPDKDQYPHRYVAALCGIDAITGTSSTEFSPWIPITRAQVVTVLVRAIDTLEPTALLTQPDMSLSVLGEFSEDHAHTMAVAEASGLLAGVERYGRTWDPWATATRGETVQILHNLIRL
ncbi:MAG: hypothetical protein GX604_10165 [Actinobacteria bacterium]|nr:hypothetical protein [Actinomycetota bacterium]